MRYAASTHVGRVRKRNEDYYYIPTEGGPDLMIAVADGMGGYRGGDVASKLGIEVLCNVFASRSYDNLCDLEALIYDAVNAANSAIWDYAQDNEFLAGMGSTMVLSAFMEGHAVIANVGDSRAYLLRDGELTQLTTDHSLVQELLDEGRITEEEAYHHPRRNIITRALGSEDSVLVDVSRHEVREGDILMLISDGLNTQLSDTEIKGIMIKHNDLQAMCGDLIDSANEAGGHDNITIAMVKISQEVM